MAKILLVDDSTELLELFSMILTAKGNLVRTATTIKLAEQQLAAVRPDLVFLDVNLKNEDGRQLCYVLSMDHNIPVILISGDAVKLENHTRFGAIAVLEKPFRADHVHALIKAVAAK